MAFWEEVLVLSFIKWKQHVSKFKKINRINMFSRKYFVMQIDPLCYCESKEEFPICNFHSIFLFAHWLMLKWNYYGIKLAQIIWWDKNRNLVRFWKYPIVPNNYIALVFWEWSRKSTIDTLPIFFHSKRFEENEAIWIRTFVVAFGSRQKHIHLHIARPYTQNDGQKWCCQCSGSSCIRGMWICVE